MTRRALDQSSRYADLSLDEATLVKNLAEDRRVQMGLYSATFVRSHWYFTICQKLRIPQIESPVGSLEKFFQRDHQDTPFTEASREY